MFVAWKTGQLGANKYLNQRSFGVFIHQIMDKNPHFRDTVNLTKIDHSLLLLNVNKWILGVMVSVVNVLLYQMEIFYEHKTEVPTM